MTPDEATLAWMRTRADASLTIASTAGSKLGTWLLVGNAAALVLVLKAATDRAVCEGVLQTSASWFSAGLFLAFAGWAVSYLSSIASVRLSYTAVEALSTIVGNGYHIERLEAELGANYQRGPLEEGVEAAGAVLVKLPAKLKWLWLSAILSLALFAGSALSFGGGVMEPVSAASLKICSDAGTVTIESPATRQGDGA